MHILNSINIFKKTISLLKLIIFEIRTLALERVKSKDVSNDSVISIHIMSYRFEFYFKSFL